MLTQKDKVEQFKRDLRSYNYYLGMIEECNIKLVDISVKLQGVSSPSMHDVILENAGNPYSTNKIELMMLEEKLITERNKWLKEVKRIDVMLDKIDIKYRPMIIELFVDKRIHSKVASDNFLNRQNMYKLIDNKIKEIFEDCDNVTKKTC